MRPGGEVRGFPELTTKIVGQGIPSVGQARMSEALRRRVGCTLVWHERRRVFIVVRLHGGTSPHTFYPIEIGNELYPMTDWLIGACVALVRASDAFTNDDPVRAMAEFGRTLDERYERERNAFIAERMPDFRKDFTRRAELLQNGERASRPVFWDRGATN